MIEILLIPDDLCSLRTAIIEMVGKTKTKNKNKNVKQRETKRNGKNIDLDFSFFKMPFG